MSDIPSRRTLIARRITPWLQAIASLSVALAMWTSASALYRLHSTVGPAAQIVNIRWAPTAARAARERAEAELGLIEVGDPGSADQTATRAYRLSRRSRDDIRRIVSHPLVVDTHHIDHAALRVSLDQPEMSAWLRQLLEAGQAPLAAWCLVLGGGLALWFGRRGWRRVVGRRVTPPTAATRKRLALALGGALAVLTFIALIATAMDQIYDTNFYTLWESTALLAGDHPYRDFYEWGVPLQAVLSMVGQLLSGHRLIGEFLLQWTCIVAGSIICFGLGVRLSRSEVASFVMGLFALGINSLGSGTYHYPKLLLYPAGVWLCFRYLDWPSTWRASALGALTAVAFLMRHDHGVYVGVGAVLAAVIAPFAAPTRWTFRDGARHTGAFVLTSLALLAPWIAVVERSEGLSSYVTARASLSREWAPGGSPFLQLLNMNPVRALEPDPGVQPTAERPSSSRANLLTRVRDYVGDWHWPSDAGTFMWLVQITLLVPVLLLLSSVVHLSVSWSSKMPPMPDTWHVVLASVLLIIIDHRIIREPAYFMLVTPLTAALGARFVSARWRRDALASPARPWPTRVWPRVRTAIVLLMLSVTAVSIVAAQRDDRLRNTSLDRVRNAFSRLTAQPAIDGYIGPDVAPQFTRATWQAADEGVRFALRVRFVSECSLPDDRLFVTGSTPFDIPYYANRKIAGGHLFWHVGWRSDAEGEAQSLALLERQSVPFIVSTTAPIVEEVKLYPAIRQYFERNYVEPDGAEGRLLIDRRRKPTSYFEPMGWPCFGDTRQRVATSH